jgi:hypothetical protein
MEDKLRESFGKEHVLNALLRVIRISIASGADREFDLSNEICVLIEIYDAAKEKM